MKVKLILTDVNSNNNKYWYAELLPDGSVQSEWGRVGYPAQVTNYPASRGGQRFFDKKIAEKKKKGYKELKIAESGSTSSSAILPPSDLTSVVKSQIITSGDPVLDKLIDQLIQKNIHSILQNSKITYNSSSGLFQTPLGVVTDDGITEARQVLADIGNLLGKTRYDSTKLLKLANEYFCLIPNNIGMQKLNVPLFFNSDGLQKQLNILDSLEASYNAMKNTPVKKDDSSKKQLEKVFDTKLSTIDAKEATRIENWFHDSKKKMHHYDHVTVTNVYGIDIASDVIDKSKGNVVEVFHGTNCCNSLSILRNGLKIAPPSTAAIAGKLWGNGVYGATCSSKSLGYCFGRWGQGYDKIGHIYVCDFVMGKPFYPKTYGGKTIPPEYDSCWALASNTGLANDELIVYNENQLKIKYLIECKEK